LEIARYQISILDEADRMKVFNKEVSNILKIEDKKKRIN
jgi:hypothetical protein